MESEKLRRGNVRWVNLDPTQGPEIKKMRPCVLVAATPINQARRAVLAVPLSSFDSTPHPPITVRISCMEKRALAVCDQLRAVDKIRLTDWIELIEPKSLDTIGRALQQILSI